MTDLLKDFEAWFREMRRLIQVALGRFSRETERTMPGFGFDFLPGGFAGLDEIIERGCGLYRSASEEDRELMRSLFASTWDRPLTWFFIEYGESVAKILSRTRSRSDLERALTVIAMISEDADPGAVTGYALPLYHEARKAGVPDLEECFRRAGELASKTPPGYFSPCEELSRIPAREGPWSLMMEEREKLSSMPPIPSSQ